MLRYLAVMAHMLLLMVFFGGCGVEGDRQDGSHDIVAEPADVEVADPNALMRTNYYYVSNPPATSGGCSSALRLSASGTGITEVTPQSGCWINQLGPHPSWDSKTSAGTTYLSDTWYLQGTAFDKDYTFATGEAWCDPANTVTVKVVGTTITSLTYWFTDDWDCFW